MAAVTPEQVRNALMKDPDLLWETVLLLQGVKIAGPWTKRSGSDGWFRPTAPRTTTARDQGNVTICASIGPPTKEARWTDCGAQIPARIWYHWSVFVGDGATFTTGFNDSVEHAMEAVNRALASAGYVLVSVLLPPSSELEG